MTPRRRFLPFTLSGARAARLAPIATLGLLMGVTGRAEARPAMPGALRDAADMPCVPSCGICHESSAGGGALRSPGLGSSLLEVGLDTTDPDAMPGTLDASRSLAQDSDGDGELDVDELAAGTDPNTAGAASLCGPEYGCARVEPRGNVDGVASLAALLTVLGGVLVARRRR